MLQNYKKLSDLPRKFQSYQNSIKSVLFVTMLKKKVGSEVSFKKCSPIHAETNNTAMHLSTSCPSVTPDNYELLLHKAVTPRWSSVLGHQLQTFSPLCPRRSLWLCPAAFPCGRSARAPRGSVLLSPYPAMVPAPGGEVTAR